MIQIKERKYVEGNLTEFSAGEAAGVNVNAIVDNAFMSWTALEDERPLLFCGVSKATIIHPSGFFWLLAYQDLAKVKPSTFRRLRRLFDSLVPRYVSHVYTLILPGAEDKTRFAQFFGFHHTISTVYAGKAYEVYERNF